MPITPDMMQEARSRTVDQEIVALAIWLADGRDGEFLIHKLRGKRNKELVGLIGASPDISDKIRGAAILALTPKSKRKAD